MFAFATLLSQLRRWAEYQRVRAELTQIDDRALADMGFSRGEIAYIAREASRAIR